MLRFSESDPKFEVDTLRLGDFEAEISSEAYEAKVAGLIRRAHAHDVRSDGSARAAYREAYDALSLGDHYLLIMLNEALGARPRGRVQAIAKSGLFVILIPTTGLAMLIAAGLGGILLSGQPRSAREAMFFILGFFLFAGAAWYLVRLMIRESRW